MVCLIIISQNRFINCKIPDPLTTQCYFFRNFFGVGEDDSAGFQGGCVEKVLYIDLVIVSILQRVFCSLWADTQGYVRIFNRVSLAILVIVQNFYFCL